MKIKKFAPLFITPLMLIGCNNNKHANVGLLYCASEANSLYQVRVVQQELEEKGLSTRLISFNDSNDISSVLNGVISKVDTLYIPTDNTCASNASIINAAVRENKVPVFAGEEGLCKGCGAITLSISYYNIGVKTGQMAAEVLLGTSDISTLPIAYDQNPVKKYNKDFCDDVGITVPSDYIEINQEPNAASSFSFTNLNTSNTHFNIGICQLVNHVALDAATQGFQDALKGILGETNVTFDLQIAAGDSGLCTTIVNNFVSHNVDLIMANATPALQAAANSTTTIPVLGTSITEYGVALNIPDFTGVVGGNVSGTSDLAPLKEQASMLADVFKDFMKSN